MGTWSLSISPPFTCICSSTVSLLPTTFKNVKTTHESTTFTRLMCLTNATTVVLYSPEEIIQKELIKWHPNFLQESWAPPTSAEVVGTHLPGAPRCQGTALPAQNEHSLPAEIYLLLTAAVLRELSTGRACKVWLQAKPRSARPNTVPWGNNLFLE